MTVVGFLNETKLRGFLHRRSPITLDNNRPRVGFTLVVERPNGIKDHIAGYALGDNAEHLSSIPVGNFIAVEGALRSSTWNTPSGERFNRTHLHAHVIRDYGINQLPTFDEEGDQ